LLYLVAALLDPKGIEWVFGSVSRVAVIAQLSNSPVLSVFFWRPLMINESFCEKPIVAAARKIPLRFETPTGIHSD